VPKTTFLLTEVLSLICNAIDFYCKGACFDSDPG